MDLLFGTMLAATAAPHLVAARTADRIHVDGRLDETAWRAAPVSSSFTQKFPGEGKAPAEPTHVRILYDDVAIYIGVECEQKTARIVKPLTRRDRKVESDSVTVVLDSRNDGTSGFEFSVTAAGVLSDAIRFDDTDSSSDWDETWAAKVETGPQGWTAEIEIPLRVLRFGSAARQSWGLQVRRYVSERQETDEWSYIPRDAGGEVSRYGKLDGLDGLRPKPSLELRPFILGRVHHYDDQSTALIRGWEANASAGLDLKWHVSQSLTLDAALLPDFGQVEADQVILNLTTFEPYFPEKRPFFLEGLDAFATPLNLLYTRRIGRAPAEPELRFDDPYREQLYRSPEPVPIYGAAKLTGELGGRFSVGGLLALTGSENVPVQLGDGSMVDRLVEPLATYKVLRLKRALGENSHVGLIAMATNRFESTSDGRAAIGGGALCPGGETVSVGERCFHDAYVAGADARLRTEGGDYALSGQAIVSLMDKGPPRALADGTVVKSGDAGPALKLVAAKEGGKHFVWDAQYDFHGRKVDYNDLGFMLRQNQHHFTGGLEYRTLDPFWILAETHSRVELYGYQNLDWLPLSRGLQFNVSGRTTNYWSFFNELHIRPAHYDDRETGDGAALERAGLFGIELSVETDPRAAVSLGFSTQTQIRTNGANFTGDGDLKIRALPQLELELLPEGIFTEGEPRYFGTENGDYLFGKLRAEELSLTLRATYTFTPELTFQAYGQGFLSSEHFTDFTAYPIGGTPVIALNDLQRAGFKPSSSPDIQQGAVNANLLFRWEYLPGSTAYLVYTHAQADQHVPFTGDDGGLRLRLLKPRAAADAFLFKMSYFWG